LRGWEGERTAPTERSDFTIFAFDDRAAFRSGFPPPALGYAPSARRSRPYSVRQ
jgi:hypothetical protein